MRILVPAGVLALFLAVLVTGCGRPIDIQQALQITDIAGGYHDAGIVDGKNKLVPSVNLRIKKTTDADIRPLSLNVVFKKVVSQGVEEDWDETYVQSVPFEGNQTALLTIQTKAGYTGDPPQSRADILKHSMFRDVRVHIFAKHSSSQWVEIGTYNIPRQVLAQ